MTRLHLHPQGVAAKLRYWSLGQPLLRHLAAQLRGLPDELSVAERHAAQQQAAGTLLHHLQVRLLCRGLEHVGDGPYLLVALHESLLDVPALLSLPLQQRFVARDEIFSWPLLGPAITRLGHLRICPEQGASSYRHLLQQGRHVTAGGESLVLFPQGSVLGIEVAFQPGAFKLAQRLGLPILPVVLTGGHRVWEHPFSPTLRYGQAIGLEVLPPISAAQVQTSSAESLRSEVQRAMKAVALAGRLPSPRRYDPYQDGYWDGYRFDIDPAFPALHAAVQQHRTE